MLPANVRDGFVYRLDALPEDDGPEGHFASGDDEQDAKWIAEIREDMEWNEWAWCVARVSVWHSAAPELKGTAYLGGCSYKDADDFRAGGYYTDMCDEAATDLEAKLEALKGVICSEDSPPCKECGGTRVVTPQPDEHGNQPENEDCPSCSYRQNLSQSR